MNAFDQAFANTVELEGGYSNNPNDKGGETYQGISRVFNPDWEGWKIIDALKGFYPNLADFEAELSKNQELGIAVKNFYRSMYWDKMNLDAVSKNIEYVPQKLFDIGVNQGIETAGKFFQRAINCFLMVGLHKLELDGIIGSQTIMAMRMIPVGAYSGIFKMLNAQQCLRYMEIVENNPTQSEFLSDWIFHRVS